MNALIRRWAAVLSVAAPAVVAAVALAMTVDPSASASTTPGWEPDPQASSYGYVALANSSGAVVTSGSIDDHPIAAYAVASHAGRSGDNLATLAMCTPQAGVNAQNWSCDNLTGSTQYAPADPSVPSAVSSTALPFATGTSGDLSVNDIIGEFPNGSTDPGYQNMFELRIYTSGPGQAASTTQYDRTDILVSGSSWQVVYPGDAAALPGSSATPTPTPTVTPTSTPTDSGSPTPTASASSTAQPTVSATASETASGQPSSTPSGTVRPTGSPTPRAGLIVAIDSSGRALKPDPTLLPGDTAKITVPGFRPGELVRITMHSSPMLLGSRSADSSGVLVMSFTVPRNAPSGSHEVTFAGASVTRSWPFRVADSAFATGSAATSRSSTSGDATAGTTAAASSGRLPHTGARISTLMLYAVALLWSGAVLMVAGRRRRLFAAAAGRHRFESAAAGGGRHRRR